MSIIEIIADNVRRIRQSKGLSQEDFADRANLHRTYVSGIERCRRNPTANVIEAMASALEVAPAELLKEPENDQIK